MVEGMKDVKHLKLKNPFILGYDINYYYREPHDHNFYEILVVAKGNSIHTVNDDVQILKAGDMILIRPSDTHSFSPYSKNSDIYEFYNIHISCKHMETQYRYSAGLKAKIEEPKLPVIVNLGTKNLIYISQKLKKMNSMNFGEERNFLYYSILKDALWHILETTHSPLENEMPEWFKNYLVFISKPDVFVLDYSEISAKANVTESYLWKMFKKHINMSPTEYINNLRLEYAYELIRNSIYSLGEIAITTGFNSYSYFYRKFTEKYSISPKKVREK